MPTPWGKVKLFVPRVKLIRPLASLAFAAAVAVHRPHAAAQEIMPDPAAPTAADLEDRRIVMITGSTGGLGREVALAMGDPGTHAIVHGRNRERGLEVVDSLHALGATAAFYGAGLASMDEVRTLGEAILRDYDRLDALVTNAGIGLSGDDTRYESPDGYELSFAVNYLSGFLLTNTLLPIMPDGPDSRVVNVASGAQSPIDFDDPMIEENYSGGRSYGQSKLAQILFTVELAERVEDRRIVVTSLHPATLMDTDMVLEAGVTPRSTVEEGRDAVLNLIRSDGIESGSYHSGLSPARANDQAYDDEAQERLWEMSEEWVGL